MHWITYLASDADFLKELGVEVYNIKNLKDGFVDAEFCATEENLSKLDPHWGRFIWGPAT